MSPSQEVRRGYWHYTYPPQNWCACLHFKRWRVLTLHIHPPKLMYSSLPIQEVGVLTLHIPPKLMCSVSKSRGGVGIDITHTTRNWCAQVSKSRGGGYWYYTYPSPTKLMCSTILVGGGSILMCMGKEGVVLITMHSNKSGVRFLSYLF